MEQTAKPPPRSRSVLILGAGWSASAGLPLARDLVAGPLYVVSETARARAQAVLRAWEGWLEAHPGGTAEPFLSDVLAGDVRVPPDDPTTSTLFDGWGGPVLPWPWAVEAVAVRLAFPKVVSPDDPERSRAVLIDKRHSNRLRYSGNLTLPANTPVLQAFVRDLLGRYELIGVVTTNYDTLAERVLRHRPMRRGSEPGFFYGGLPQPQLAHGHLPWDRLDPYHRGGLGQLALQGTVPIFKLHGSLNWESGGKAIAIFRDQRCAFRHGGTAAIVPPTMQKSAPMWLDHVWGAAREVLATASQWVVVGYSLPPYDGAVEELFRSAAAAGVLRRIEVHDPRSADVAKRWRAVCDVPVVARAGLAPASVRVVESRQIEPQDRR